MPRHYGKILQNRSTSGPVNTIDEHGAREDDIVARADGPERRADRGPGGALLRGGHVRGSEGAVATGGAVISQLAALSRQAAQGAPYKVERSAGK